MEEELCPVGREALSSKEAEIKAPKERVSQLEDMVDPSAIPPIVSSSLATTVSSGVAAGTHEAHKSLFLPTTQLSEPY